LGFHLNFVQPTYNNYRQAKYFDEGSFILKNAFLRINSLMKYLVKENPVTMLESGNVKNGAPRTFDPSRENGALNAFSEMQKHAFESATPFRNDFTPVIESFIQTHDLEHVKPSYPPKYFVLVIISEGQPFDLLAFRSSLSKYNHLPMSIIFVDINEHVSNQSSNYALTREKSLTQRNIFQYYRYIDWVNDEVLWSRITSEIPDQFLTYMEQHKIYPSENEVKEYLLSLP